MPAIPGSRRSAAEVYALLGFKSEAAMNHARRRLQMTLDAVTQRVAPYPDFAALYPDLTRSQRRALEVEYERKQTLVVPLWGGIKYPSSAWSYDLRACARMSGHGALADGPSAANAEASRGVHAISGRHEVPVGEAGSG